MRNCSCGIRKSFVELLIHGLDETRRISKMVPSCSSASDRETVRITTFRTINFREGAAD
jgi:hypothetical protein